MLSRWFAANVVLGFFFTVMVALPAGTWAYDDAEEAKKQAKRIAGKINKFFDSVTRPAQDEILKSFEVKLQNYVNPDTEEKIPLSLPSYENYLKGTPLSGYVTGAIQHAKPWWSPKKGARVYVSALGQSKIADARNERANSRVSVALGMDQTVTLPLIKYGFQLSHKELCHRRVTEGDPKDKEDELDFILCRATEAILRVNSFDAFARIFHKTVLMILAKAVELDHSGSILEKLEWTIQGSKAGTKGLLFYRASYTSEAKDFLDGFGVNTVSLAVKLSASKLELSGHVQWNHSVKPLEEIFMQIPMADDLLGELNKKDSLVGNEIREKVQKTIGQYKEQLLKKSKASTLTELFEVLLSPVNELKDAFDDIGN